MTTKPVIFISYAHLDEPEKPRDGEVQWLSFVTGFLEPAEKRGGITVWTDRLMPGGAEWNAETRQGFGNTVIDTIARHSPNFKDLILHAEIRTPWDIENEVGLTEGNIFQGELTMDQLLFNRPVPGYAQYRSPVRGVYMCGSSTHPGGGVMGAPGANAARAVLRDMGRAH